MIRVGIVLALAATLQAATAHLSAAGGRSIVLRAADGATLAASLYESGQTGGPGVVLVHMLRRTHADWNTLADALQQSGVTVVALDLRGHGSSPGHADPDGDLGGLVQDVQAAVGLLAARSDVGRGRIGIAGASLGASLAALAAAADPSVRSIALLSPSLDYRGVRCEAALKKYAPRPALLVAASDDPYAMRSMRQLTEAGPANEALTLEGAGHGTMMLTRDPDLVGRLVEWFRKTL
jgi:alpha-beta hydrolase superfamily lysophospholipase